jgi:uncharacterized protein
MRCWLGAAVLLAMVPMAGRAQGIDCSRARSPTEKAICASPTLMGLDRQVAIAYADALARQPDRRDAMRRDLLGWLRARDAACNVPSAGIDRCLSGQLTARLAALAPPPPTTPAPAAAPPPAQATAAPPADPAIPAASFDQPAPVATLDAASLPVASEADTLLHVTSPGRFTIAAHSSSGAALQLVDMLTGPSDIAGAAGSQDGRLDQLLDVGTYKLRAFTAPGASGLVGLTVTPFHDAAPPAALPQPGRALAAALRDGEQRAFWLLVPPGGGDNVRIEAAGRSLADLRLWRDGRELTALDPASQTVTPAPGHPLTDLRIVGRVEPGTYLAVAYGGPSLPWTDNDAAQPFHLRAGASNALAEGWAGGTVGPFGSEVFTLPPTARILRLDLPAPAAADLRVADAVATIDKTSREPSVTLVGPEGRQQVAELRAAAGQPFTLHALDGATRRVWSQAGTWWVSAVTNGLGADEAPPTLLLQRTEGPDKPPRIVASTAPLIGPGAAWHARFNLRGPTHLLFQSPSGGDVGFSSTGVDIRHGSSERATMPSGYILLSLEPIGGKTGSLEVIVGAPGSKPPPMATPLPADPVIPLGLQTLAPGQQLRLDAGDAADSTTGLVVRASPVALAAGPLLATIAAGNSLSIPVLVAPGGQLSVTELGVGPIDAGQTDNTQPGRTTVVIPVSDHPRTVALAWRPNPATPAAIPAPPPPGQVVSVTAGTPSYLDLARGEERGFALTVPEGGLFRVETTGRLHTSGRMATPFVPQLATADGNGVGQNMLIQSDLRAGRYRVDVRAVESAGHLGLLARPAPLLAGGTLVPGGSVRTSLPGGSGVSFPVSVTGPADGRYHFDVLSLGTPWTGRLEDAEGWPMVTPGPLDGLETALRPGQYRLVVAPDAVGRQVVARLTAITKPTEITGHGPHPLPFEQPQTATWREPDGRDQSRPPDVWAFSLPGPAEVTLKLANGMSGELRRADAVVTRVAGRWTGTLEAGDYQLLATSLGHNDRLGYTVALSSPALQPGAPRSVTLPASLPFSLAASRVVSLTSWGTTPVKAVLRQEGGAVVARYNSRAGDWNIAASRRLPAGRYVLDLQSAAPPDVAAPSSASAPDADDSDASDSDAPNDDGAAQTAATQGAKPPAKDDAPAPSDDSDATAPTVDVSLALPAELPAKAAPSDAAVLDGTGVHVLTLPRPDAGSLLVAAAGSTAPLVLALERAEAGGWRTVAIGTGTGPMVAAPADSGADDWRLESWTIDGGPEPIHLAARALAVAPQSGQVTLAAVDGMPLAVARAVLPDAGIVALAGTMPGLLAGGWPGHTLEPAAGNLVADGKDVWLLAPQPGAVTVGTVEFLPGHETILQLPAGLGARLPASDGAMWRVSSGTGQPDLGIASGIAESSAVALATAPVDVSGSEAMRLRVIRDAPKLLPAQVIAGALQIEVPPGAALPLTLPQGDKRLELSLAPGLAAFAGWHDAAPVAVWTGANAVSRTLDGAWTELLLVNTTGIAAPARITAQPAPAASALQPGTLLKRFFGSAGSFAVAFDAPTKAHLMTAGDATVTAVTSAAVTSGTAAAVSGPGRAVVRHGIGAVALWLDTPTVSAWPEPPAQTVSLPARMALSTPAATLRFDAASPVLLHVSTTAPVFAGLQQAGRTDAPALFAAGAELHRAVAAGPVTLRLISADDGPMSGTVSVWAETLVPIGEGLGDSVAVAPGGTAAFSFTLAHADTIGVGLRAEPDQAQARLLDAHGAIVGEGVAQLQHLAAGDYVLEARVPPGAPPTLLRPALVGITPRGSGPPPDVVQTYLELVGMKPQKAP